MRIGSTASSFVAILAGVARIVILIVSTLHVFDLKTTALSMSAASAAAATRRIVVVGGGVQGTSVAYQMAKKATSNENNVEIVLLESKEPASAASGKGGGFMARSWGNGSPTQGLHELAFDLYVNELAPELPLTTFRTLPVLSVAPGPPTGSKQKGLLDKAQKDKRIAPLLPNWLDGSVGRIQPLGFGDDTAQVTPKEFVTKMLEQQSDRIQVILGTCQGFEFHEDERNNDNKNNDDPPPLRLKGVKYTPRKTTDENEKESIVTIPADDVVISAGPWSCAAEDWLDNAIQLPMEGIKSTSIIWKKPEDASVDATALFCGEDDEFSTHLEVYPRPDGTIYLCGIGGSDYIEKDALKQGAFRETCLAKDDRVEAATKSFEKMSARYQSTGVLERTQACMRPCPPDGLPYMGAIPGYQGIYMNAGHNCWGIAWAPACGKAMAELVLDGKCSCVNLDPFDPSRFTSSGRRGGRGRKRRGTSVGEQW